MRGRLPIVQPPSRPLPPAAATLTGALAHTAKTRLLQARRLALWRLRPDDFGQPPRTGSFSSWPRLLYERAIPIRRSDAAADESLEEGKQINLKLAAAAFDGLVTGPGAPLSFWRVLGRVSEARGYRMGMEISAGCLRPAVGGGLCLLANGLFELAARLGWDIIERHGHTMEAVPPVPGELWGLDATVFWPYVDLRVRPREQVALSVRVDDEALQLIARGREPPLVRAELLGVDETIRGTPEGRWRLNRIQRRLFSLENGALVDEQIIAENDRRILTSVEMGRTCYTCGEESCHRRVEES
jgi:vancomycin resistance protein VanW